MKLQDFESRPKSNFFSRLNQNYKLNNSQNDSRLKKVENSWDHSIQKANKSHADKRKNIFGDLSNLSQNAPVQGQRIGTPIDDQSLLGNRVIGSASGVSAKKYGPTMFLNNQDGSFSNTLLITQTSSKR